MNEDRKNLKSYAAGLLKKAIPMSANFDGASSVGKFLFEKFANDDTKKSASEIAKAGGQLSSALGDIAVDKAQDVVQNTTLEDFTPANIANKTVGAVKGLANFGKAAAQDTTAGVVRVADTIGTVGNKAIGNEDFTRISDYSKENQSGTAKLLTGENISSHKGTQEATSNLLSQLGLSEDNTFAPLIAGAVAGTEFLLDIPIVGTLTKAAAKPLIKRVLKQAGKEIAKETSEEVIEQIVKKEFKELALSDQAIKDLTKDLVATKDIVDVKKVLDNRVSEFQTKIALDNIRRVNAKKGVDDVIKEGRELSDEVIEEGNINISGFDDYIKGLPASSPTSFKKNPILSEVLSSDKLYEKYPELKYVNVNVSNRTSGSVADLAVSSNGNVSLSVSSVEFLEPTYPSGYKKTGNAVTDKFNQDGWKVKKGKEDEFIKSIMHEVEHVKQQRFGKDNILKDKGTIESFELSDEGLRGVERSTSVNKVGSGENRLSEIEAVRRAETFKSKSELMSDFESIGKSSGDLLEEGAERASKSLDEIYEEINFKPREAGETPKLRLEELSGLKKALQNRLIKVQKDIDKGVVDELVGERQLKTINKQINSNTKQIEKLTAQEELINTKYAQSASESLEAFSFDKPRTANQIAKVQTDKRLKLFDFRKGSIGSSRSKNLVKQVKEEVLVSFDKVRRHLELVRGEEILNSGENFVADLYLQNSVINARNILSENLQKSLASSLKRKYGKAAGKVRSEISEYMYARHSLDFNKVHADVKNAAGISTSDAMEIVKRIGAKYIDDPVFKNTVETITEYNRGQLKQALDAGLISKEAYDKIRANYKNYVPLFRAGDDEASQLAKLINFGKTSKTVDFAEGGERIVDDVIDNSFFKGQSVNRSVVNNETKKTMGKFIKESNQDFVKENFTVKPVTENYVLKKGNEVDFYSEGKRYAINMPSEYIEPWTEYGFKKSALWKNTIGMLGKPTKFYSKMLTSYNPSFKPVSFIRDGMESIQIADDVMGTATKDLTGLDPRNLKKAWSGIYDYQKGLMTPNAKYYDEALNLYGISTGRFAKSLEKTGQSKFSDLTTKKTFPTLSKIGESLSNADELFENSIRQSHYIRARQKGFSAKDAAIVAQEAGINFSKSGRFTEFLAPAFMFLNATVQGNTNFVRSLKNPKVLAKFTAGLTAGATAQETWNTSMFGPDWRNEVDEYILNSHFVIGIGYNDDNEFEYIKIPLPHGAMPFWTMTNGVADIAYERNTAENVLSDSLSMAFTTLSPLGGGVITDSNLNTDDGGLELAKSLGNEVVPSILKPAYQSVVNQNHFGNKIVLPEMTVDENGQSVQKVDENGNKVFKSSEEYGDRGAIEKISDNISKGVADIIGEGKYQNQRMIKHLLSNYLATGVGKEVINTSGEIVDAATGEKVDLDKIVISDKLFGRSNKNSQGFRDERVIKDKLDVLDGNKGAQRELLIELAINNQYLNPELSSKYGIDLTHNHALMNASPQSAHYFNKLTTPTDDEDFEETRIAAIEKMKNEYESESHLDYKDLSFASKQYKGLVEYLAGKQQIHKLPRNEIQSWFAKQGIVKDKITKTDVNKIEDRFYNLKRAVTPNASELYERFDQLEDSLKDGELSLTEAEENEFLSEQYVLYKEELLSKTLFDKRIKDMKKASAESNLEILIEKIEEGADPRSLLADIKTYYSEETEDLFIDYLKQTGRLN